MAVKPSYEPVAQPPDVCLDNSFHPKRYSIHWREAAPYLPGDITTAGRDVSSWQADACGTCSSKAFNWPCPQASAEVKSPLSAKLQRPGPNARNLNTSICCRQNLGKAVQQCRAMIKKHSRLIRVFKHPCMMVLKRKTHLPGLRCSGSETSQASHRWRHSQNGPAGSRGPGMLSL